MSPTKFVPSISPSQKMMSTLFRFVLLTLTSHLDTITKGLTLLQSYILVIQIADHPFDVLGRDLIQFCQISHASSLAGTVFMQ
jgi:hypothetical protein